MERCEHMIRRRYDFHEVFLDDCLMFYECDGHIFEYDSLFFQFFSEIMIDDFTIILCPDSCEYLPFSFRDTESIECFLDRIWNIIPRFLITGSFRFPKIIYRIEVEVLE